MGVKIHGLMEYSGNFQNVLPHTKEHHMTTDLGTLASGV